MTPPKFLTPSASRWKALLSYPRLSNAAKVLMVWLVFSAEPRDGIVHDVTQSSLAAELAWSRQAVRRALDELADAGMIDAVLPRGAHSGGEVRVLAYYDVMQPTKWLNRQRAIGDKVDI